MSAFAFIDGKPHPITTQQWDQARRHQSIGQLVASAHVAAPPRAAAPPTPPAPPAPTEAETRAKAAAFDAQMAAQASDERASRRTANLKRIARHGGPEGVQAKRVLAEEDAAAGQKAEAAEMAALPNSIDEAGGDAHAYGMADMKRRVAAMRGKGTSTSGRASMERELRKMGMEPAKASHG